MTEESINRDEYMSEYLGTTDSSKEDDFHRRQTIQHGQDIANLKQGQARLEVSVGELGRRVDNGFESLEAVFKTAVTPKPPTPWVNIALLCISILTVFGGVLAFGFGLITGGIQRETDLRFSNMSTRHVETFQNVQKSFGDIYDRFGVDDRREQSDAHEFGKMTAQLEDLRVEVDENRSRVEEKENLQQEWRLRIETRVGAAESIINSSGRHLHEHINKEGSMGHPALE